MTNKKILVIDDDPGIVRLDQSLLQTLGYEMVSASDGVEGIKKAKEEKPVLIFLDVILPEMHGFEVCKKLKEDSDTADIPVILVTASGLEEVARNEPNIPAQGYIAKPYGIKELGEAIEAVLKD